MSNFNVMNAALLAVVVLFAGYEFPSFFHAQAKYVPPAPAKSAETENKTAESQPLSASEYGVIAEQNVFHPDRIIPVFKPDAPPLPKPEFVLYGTLIAGDISLAYMEDMKGSINSPTRGKRQKALRKGETLSGFILKEIETDKVLMVRGDEKLEVRITDKARSKSSGTAPAAQVSSPQSAQPLVIPPQTQTEDAKKRRDSLRNVRGARGGPIPK